MSATTAADATPDDAALPRRRVVVIGAGPAGLMAAEAARDAGADVALYEQMPSVARKFLIAGKGGLNLTHSEDFGAFVGRYRERSEQVGAWLEVFGADALRAWALDLGYPTVIGSSGRVFPADFKAGPLLRAWVRRIRGKGVSIHCGQRWLGWSASGALRFHHAGEDLELSADAVVLALGGGSWSALGADGRWTETLTDAGLSVAPLRPANCGFECDWSAHLIARYAGSPVKSVTLKLDYVPWQRPLLGEFVLSAYGVEGSAIYALSAPLRETIEREGQAKLLIDLCPSRSVAQLAQALGKARAKRSFTEHLRRAAGVDGVKAGLVYECIDAATRADPMRLAQALKALPLLLLRPRPLDEAISSAGGLSFEELDSTLRVRRLPQVWCAGEMIDWEAPTGGYLLTACFASGYIAGRAAAAP